MVEWMLIHVEPTIGLVGEFKFIYEYTLVPIWIKLELSPQISLVDKEMKSLCLEMWVA